MELDYIEQGDCLELMKHIPYESIDLIVTDPPYLIKYKTNYRKDKNHKYNFMIENDDAPHVISKAIRECYRVLKNNSAMYMFSSPDKIDFFKAEIEKAGFNIKNIIIWVKNNWTAGDLQAQFGKQYEMLILANKGRKKFNEKRITDVWEFNRVPSSRSVHQNEKPIPLIEQCIKKHSNEGDLILDPFLGSGTTAVACVNTNRHYIGFEIDEQYFDIACKRLDEVESEYNLEVRK